MTQWKELGFFKSFARQREISNSIGTYGRKLGFMKDTFQVRVLPLYNAFKHSDRTKIGALARIGFEAEASSVRGEEKAESHMAVECIPDTETIRRLMLRMQTK